MSNNEKDTPLSLCFDIETKNLTSAKELCRSIVLKPSEELFWHF
jgi:hypothetical protein